MKRIYAFLFVAFFCISCTTVEEDQRMLVSVHGFLPITYNNLNYPGGTVGVEIGKPDTTLSFVVYYPGEKDIPLNDTYRVDITPDNLSYTPCTVTREKIDAYRTRYTVGIAENTSGVIIELGLFVCDWSREWEGEAFSSVALFHIRQAAE